MTALREVFARFGVQFETGPLAAGDQAVQRTTQRLGGLDRLVKRMSASLSTLGIAIGAGVAIHGLSRFVTSTVEIGDELENTAIRVGMSTTALQSWRHAAELSNVSAEEFSTGIRMLQRQAFEASTGTSESAESFRRLGISVTGAGGQLKNADQLLLETGVALNNLPDLATRTALSMRLLGRGGNALLPMFVGGAEGVSRMRAELETLGGGASPEMIRQAAELDDDFVRLRVSLMSVRSAIAVYLLPVVNRGIEVFTRFSAWLREANERSTIIPATFAAIGVAAVAAAAATIGAWGPAVLTVVAVAAAIAVLVLVVDDLYTAIADPEADTLLRRFLTWAGGAEWAAEKIALLTRAIQTMKDVWGEAASGVAGFFGIETEFGQSNEARRRATERGGDVREIIGSSTPEMTAQQQRIRHATERAQRQTASLRWGNERPTGTGARLMNPEAWAALSPPTVAASTTTAARQVNVTSAPVININGVTDPQAVGRVVDRRLREHEAETLRRIQGATDTGGESS